MSINGLDVYMCRHDGDPYDVLPELVYLLSAFDDPDDVEEAQQSSKDQSLWVSGVFLLGDKIVWVDELGDVIREKVVDLQDRAYMTEAAEAFKQWRLFESSWWTEATKVGKYADEQWWL